MTNPPKNDTPDKALVELRTRAQEILAAQYQRDDHPRAESILMGFRDKRAVDAVEIALASENGILGDIAVMMSEFVENWPNPKKIDTAIKLIAKTLRAALASNSPVVGEDGPPETIDGVETGNTVAPNTPTDTADRSCTCHPDDRPEGPCPQKFAASACIDTADRREAVRRIANDIYLANSDVLCEADCKEIESIVERAIASLIAGPLEGFVMVPVEPTEAMLEAGPWIEFEPESYDSREEYLAENRKALRDVWSAMIAARPIGDA